MNPRPKEKWLPKPENLIPVSEYRVNYLRKAGKKNKYNASKIDSGGYRFDSKLEARVFEDLEFARLSGHLIEIRRQVKIPLMVNGVLICNYIIDFVVIDKHGQKKYIEVKGFRTALWEMKWKLCMAMANEICPGAEWEIIKQ